MGKEVFLPTPGIWLFVRCTSTHESPQSLRTCKRTLVRQPGARGGQNGEVSEQVDSREPNGDRYETVRTALDIPMILLAVTLAVVLIVQYFFELSESADRWLTIAGWLIWGLFVAEFVLLYVLADNKATMVRSHKLDLFLIVLPMLRPLRALRVLRVFAGLSASGMLARRVLRRRGLDWFLLAVTAVVLLGATAVWQLEQREPDAIITSFREAVWWAIVTCTTVGYGDESPVSGGGQIIAVVLMLVGISMLSIVTANIASIFVQADRETTDEGEADQLQAIEARVNDLDRKLDLILERISASPETEAT